MLNKAGHEIPRWRIEANEKQLFFQSVITGILSALTKFGYTGWKVQHVMESQEDVEFNAGLKSYYGTCTFTCDHDYLVDGHPPEGFNIILWMSNKRGESSKAYFNVSHRDLERYKTDKDDNIKVGVDITRSPESVAGDIIRRVIIPARVEHEILDARRVKDIHRRAGIVMVCDDLVCATEGVLTVQLDPDKLKDKNTGAELKYLINYNTKIEGKVSYYAEHVDLAFKDLSTDQAYKLLELYHSTAR